MYLDYYGLKSKPFRITCDPKFLWLGEKHQEALAMLRYGILDNRGFLLLTGEVGTGKTLLINRLVTMLPMDTVVATLPDPDLTRMDFYRMLSDGFNIPAPNDSKAGFLIDLRDFLYANAKKQQQVLLVIDEAQRLNHNLMEDIRVLSNIEFHDRKLINIFFVGQPEFNQVLRREKNRALAQRITIRYQIDPLNEDETASYIHHRLKVAGSTRKLFSNRAAKKVALYSSGIPRLVNIICDHALLTAYIQSKKKVDVGVIAECAEELRIPEWHKGASSIHSAKGLPGHTSPESDFSSNNGVQSNRQSGMRISNVSALHHMRPRLIRWGYPIMVAIALILWGSSQININDTSTSPLLQNMLMQSHHGAEPVLPFPLMVSREESGSGDNIPQALPTPSPEPIQKVALVSKPLPGKPVAVPVAANAITGLNRRGVAPAPKKTTQPSLTARKIAPPPLEVKKKAPSSTAPAAEADKGRLQASVSPKNRSISFGWPKKEDVFIQFDQANEIAVNSLPAMDQVASYLIDNPERVIYLHGPAGGKDATEGRSKQWPNRVRNIKNYLISKGVYSYQIEVLVMEARRLSASIQSRHQSKAVIEFPQNHTPAEYNADK